MKNPLKHLFRRLKRPVERSRVTIETSVPNRDKKRTVEGSRVISPSEIERVDRLMESFDDGSL